MPDVAAAAGDGTAGVDRGRGGGVLTLHTQTSPSLITLPSTALHDPPRVPPSRLNDSLSVIVLPSDRDSISQSGYHPPLPTIHVDPSSPLNAHGESASHTPSNNTPSPSHPRHHLHPLPAVAAAVSLPPSVPVVEARGSSSSSVHLSASTSFEADGASPLPSHRSDTSSPSSSVGKLPRSGGAASPRERTHSSRATPPRPHKALGSEPLQLHASISVASSSASITGVFSLPLPTHSPAVSNTNSSSSASRHLPATARPAERPTPPRRLSLAEEDEDQSSAANTLHPLLLRFKRADIEEYYISYSSSKNDEEAWKLTILCLFLYLVPFIIHHAFITPFDVRFLIVRLSVFLPVFALLLFHYNSTLLQSPSSSQLALTLVALVFFTGEHFDAYSSGDNQDLLDTGTPIFFFWVLPALHLRFPHTLVVTATSLLTRSAFTVLLALGYSSSVFCLNGRRCEAFDTPPLLILGHEAIVWVVGLASAAYCWHSERIERREFWYRNLLAETVDNNQQLLQRMLPASVIVKLQKGDTIIAEKFDHVSLLFADLVGFQRLVATTSPVFVVHVLDKVFNLFDEVSEEYGVYKVETVFDTWVGACGIHADEDDDDPTLTREERARLRLTRRDSEEEIRMKRAVNATRIAQLALAMARVGARLEAEIKADIEDWERNAQHITDDAAEHGQPSPTSRLAAVLPTLSLQIRVGIHSGSVMAGVIGRKLPRYRLFGDAVNTTARMCTNGQPGRVHVSPDTEAILRTSVVWPQIDCVDYATRPIKGKGLVSTCFLKADDGAVLAEQCRPRVPPGSTVVTFAPPPDAASSSLSRDQAAADVLPAAADRAERSDRPRSTSPLTALRYTPTHPPRSLATAGSVSSPVMAGSGPSTSPSSTTSSNEAAAPSSLSRIFSLASHQRPSALPSSSSLQAAKDTKTGLFIPRGSASTSAHLLSFADLVHRNTLLQREDAQGIGEEGEEAEEESPHPTDDGGRSSDGDRAGKNALSPLRIRTRYSRSSRRYTSKPLRMSPSHLQRRSLDAHSRTRSHTEAHHFPPIVSLSPDSPITARRSVKATQRGRSVFVTQKSHVGAMPRGKSNRVHPHQHSSISAAVKKPRTAPRRRGRLTDDSDDTPGPDDGSGAEVNEEEDGEDERKRPEGQRRPDKARDVGKDEKTATDRPRSPSSPSPSDVPGVLGGSIIVTPSSPPLLSSSAVELPRPPSLPATPTRAAKKGSASLRPLRIPGAASPHPSPSLEGHAEAKEPPSLLPLILTPSSPTTPDSASLNSTPKALKLRPSHHRAQTMSPVLGRRQAMKKFGSVSGEPGSGLRIDLPRKDEEESKELTASPEMESRVMSAPDGQSPKLGKKLLGGGGAEVSAMSLPSSTSASFSGGHLPAPAVEEARASVHSRSSRMFAHMAELKKEKEQRAMAAATIAAASAAVVPLSPVSPDHARLSQSRKGRPRDDDDDLLHPHAPAASASASFSASPGASSGLPSLALSTLDTDDLPFHMLDPETMKLGLDLSFVDYPDLERKYQQHQQAKIFLWVGVRLSLLLLVFVLISLVDLITRLTGASDASSPGLTGMDAVQRFVARMVCGLLPGLLLVWVTSRSRSVHVLCFRRPFVRVFPYLSQMVLVALCVLSANLFFTDVDLPSPNIDTWCSVIVLCGLASSLFRLPSIHNLVFVTFSTLCYTVSFVIVPVIVPSSIIDHSDFSLSLVTQCLLFCVCMFILFYVNSRVMEVRTRERYLTTLAIKKQRKDTGALLERLLPKNIIGQLLEMGRMGRDDDGGAGGGTGERALGGGEGGGWEESLEGKEALKERQHSEVSQVSAERRASSSKAFPFGGPKPSTSPRARHDRHRTFSHTMPTPLMAAVAKAPGALSSSRSHHQRDRSSLPSNMVPPPGAPPSLLANIYPSVTVMQADVCSFTPLCARSTPQQIITLLNSLFLLFDSLTDQYLVYKVETIGDAVLAVCGAPTPDTHHAHRMCELALAARDALRAFTPAHDQTPVRMRFGLHSGKVVGGVVGLKKMPRFHIYGQTVSDAGVMEQRAEPMTICMSGETWKSVRVHDEWSVAGYEVRRLHGSKEDKDGSLSHSGGGSGVSEEEGGSGRSEDDPESDGEGEHMSRRYELVRKRMDRRSSGLDGDPDRRSVVAATAAVAAG